jgi:1,4-dihydroxy-2-naphthoyl-CoA hydrolase
MSTNAAQTLNAMNQNNMISLLEIEIIEATVDRVVATMPVQAKVHQPFGLLHGGASVALAETVASLGAYLNVMDSGMGAVGIEINANHLRGKRDGIVTATATPIHKGRSTHVWQVEIRDEEGKMVCVSRCTLAIVPSA